MVKSVVADLRLARPDLPADLAELIAATIETVRRREEELFLDLQALKSPDDVSFRLAA